MLEHVWRQARRSAAADVVVATDDERIATAARGFGAEVLMTSASHRSGTERAAEVAEARGWPDDAVVVNVQGDAPLIPPTAIDQVAELLAAWPGAAMATLCTPIATVEDYRSSHVVKVVSDAGRPRPVLQPVADSRDQPLGYRRMCPRASGTSACTPTGQAPCAGLPRRRPARSRCRRAWSSLRALWLGLEIRVAVARDLLGPDVDTPDDLERAAEFLRRTGGGS